MLKGLGVGVVIMAVCLASVGCVTVDFETKFYRSGYHGDILDAQRRSVTVAPSYFARQLTWHGGVEGALEEHIVNKDLYEIALLARRLAVDSGNVVSFANDAGIVIEVEPVPAGMRRLCRQVRERIWEYARLGSDRILPVCHRNG